jgi:hypothetical protein
VAAAADRPGGALNVWGLVAERRARARWHAQNYSSETVTDQYERLLTAVYESRRRGRLPAALLDADPAIAG